MQVFLRKSEQQFSALIDHIAYALQSIQGKAVPYAFRNLMRFFVELEQSQVFLTCHNGVTLIKMFQVAWRCAAGQTSQK